MISRAFRRNLSLSTARRAAMGESGASAIEFALIAPILCFSLLATVDLGLALTERISIDHVLRSGAQVAMEDPGETDVENVMESTAASNFETESSAPLDITLEGERLSLGATRSCACPDDPDTVVACSTVCEGTVPTFIYYEMTAEKDYSGLILPSIPLRSRVQVQVR